MQIGILLPVVSTYLGAFQDLDSPVVQGCDHLTSGGLLGLPPAGSPSAGGSALLTYPQLHLMLLQHDVQKGSMAAPGLQRLPLS